LISYSVEPALPFRLDLTCWALRRRPSNIVDRWDGETYRRVLMAGGRPVEIAVTQTHRTLTVSATRRRLRDADHAAITSALERLLGLHVDLTAFYEFASGYPRLRVLVERFRGVKPPRFPSAFEALVNAITCQQLSLTVGITILNRLARLCGAELAGEHAFPAPADVAGLGIEALRTLGYSYNKAHALLELARNAGDIGEEIASMDNRRAVDRLLELRGVGRWTAEYTLLRGLGRSDVFPGDDVGARNNLERWLNLRKRLDYDGVKRVLARWRRYAGLIYFHLLLDRLEAAGYLKGCPPAKS
jgi:DNA-3-methyladenine glycosylase II